MCRSSSPLQHVEKIGLIRDIVKAVAAKSTSLEGLYNAP